MSDIAIRVENLSKHYEITVGRRQHDMLRDQIVDSVRLVFSRNGHRDAQTETIWALKNISFEIKQGEVVGVIGRNGAGKSTLLKILSRITEPSDGFADIHGRVGSLLEVGTGFHPELTGRENIYLNGAILGMKKAEIERKFDEIVEFSGVEKFIDTPVKRYSSGMHVRLAFAVAAHLEPEILIVDEVLAVGDAAFQKKCLGKMEGVAREGRTVLFVSHNMSAINSLCERVILLRNGSLVSDGPTSAGIELYLLESQGSPTAQGEILFSVEDLSPEEPFSFQAVRTVDQNGAIRSDFTNAEPIAVEFDFCLRQRIPYLKIGFELKTLTENIVFQSFHNDVSEVLNPSKSGFHYRLRTVIPGGLLNGGLYYLYPCATIHGKKWIVRNTKSLSLKVIFDVPNRNYIYVDRPGFVSPILSWSEVQEGGCKDCRCAQ